jgi:hypothetical protein
MVAKQEVFWHNRAIKWAYERFNATERDGIAAMVVQKPAISKELKL